jgi:Ni,Fe-hydrogenase III small subunit
LKIEAITPVAGNVPLELSLPNALRMVEIAGRTDIPVAAGAKQPLMRRLVTGAYAHGENGLGGAVFPEPTIKPVAESAAQVIRQIVRTGIRSEAPPASSDSLRVKAERIQREVLAILGRALAIRQVDAGSCNGCELEISGLTSPVYDCERFGLHFVASPRHADLLLVTGPVTRNMAVPLRKTYEATPDPKLVVAVGDCARTCGVFRGSYAVAGSVDQIVPVDAFVAGCPPEPADILRGILAALDRLPTPPLRR